MLDASHGGLVNSEPHHQRSAKSLAGSQALLLLRLLHYSLPIASS